MKIKIDVDCSPAEFRQLVGLPDVQSMQDRLLKELEQRFREAANRMPADAILQTWFAAWPGAMEQMRAMMDKLKAAAGS
jgi:hypothetical protein